MMLKKISTLILVIGLIMINSNLLLAAGLNEALSNNTITEIKVVGNKNIDDQKILEQVSTQIGDNIATEKLQQDMQAIFDLGYFFDIQVSFKNHQNGVMLILEVIENPKLSEVKFEGNNEIKTKKLKEILGVKEGKILNSKRLNEGVKAINSYYNEQGYILAKVIDVTIKEKDQLHLKVDEGRLNKILITGNDVTKDYVIRRELSMKPGKVFNVNLVREDLRRIYNLGYFEEVNPQLKAVEDDQQAVNLEINVKEKKTGTFSIGGGYSSSSKWTGLLNLQKDNLFGRGQRVKLNWEFGGKKTRYEIGFYEPWAFGTRTSLGFNLYNKENDTVDDKNVKEKGGDITVGRPLTKNTNAYLKFNYNDKDITDNGIENNEKTLSLTLKTIRDTRDNIFNPRLGGRQELAIEKAGFGGTTDFTKYELDLRKYLPSRTDNSWAFRLKMGGSKGDLASSNDEYYLSGLLDGVRGYDSEYYTTAPKEHGFKGDSILVGNLEYRFKIIDKVTGVAFMDAGRTFEKDFIEFDELSDLNYSLGLGARFDTPLGQLGLDYGYAPEARLDKKSDLSIRIGNRF